MDNSEIFCGRVTDNKESDLELDSEFAGNDCPSDPLSEEILLIRNSLIDFIVHRKTEMRDV